MDIFDFTTKTGWQKFLGFVLTMILEGAAIFGVSQTGMDQIDSVAALITPVIIMIGLFIVNQMAAKGKAAAAQTALETKVELVKELAISAPSVAIAMVAPASLSTQPVLIKPTSTVRERIDAAQLLVSTYDGMVAHYLSSLAERIEVMKAKMLANYPLLETVELMMKVMEQYFGQPVTSATCAVVNSILGLRGVLNAESDATITKSFFAAYEAGKMNINHPDIQKFFYAAKWQVALNIVNEAKNRVLNVDLPFLDRVSALMEFGLIEYDARKTVEQGAGSWHQSNNPNDPVFGGWTEKPLDFNQLAGIPPEIGGVNVIK